jgi:hypothetical protein
MSPGAHPMPTQWVLKQLEHKDDQSPPSSVKANECSCTLTPHIHLHGMQLYLNAIILTSLGPHIMTVICSACSIVYAIHFIVCLDNIFGHNSPEPLFIKATTNLQNHLLSKHAYVQTILHFLDAHFPEFTKLCMFMHCLFMNIK